MIIEMKFVQQKKMYTIECFSMKKFRKKKK